MKKTICILSVAAALASMSAVLLPIACAPVSMPASAVTPTPEATAAATAAPTLSATPSPSPTATPVVNTVSEQQKQDFISKTGEYSYENMESKLYKTGSSVERLNKTYNLGIVEYGVIFNDTQIVTQGWLFNYREENGNLILEVGFDSKDGSGGVIKDVIVPISFYQQHAGSGVGLEFWDYEFWQRVDSSSTFLGMKSDMGIVKEYLNDFLDKPMLFVFYSETSSNKIKTDLFGEKTAIDLDELINNNSSAVNQLLTEISDNGEKIKIGNFDKADSSLLILAGVYACFNQK